MKAKEVLKKWLIDNIGYKILAVVIACALWLVITNIQDPDYTKVIYNIPVNIINESLVTDQDYVYVVSSGDTASISITGPRSVVNRLNASSFYAKADFTELSMTNAVPITVELTEENSSYASQISITQRTVSMVLSLEKIITQSYEVGVTYEGIRDDDMFVDSVTLSPSEISVTAPESVIDSIAFVEININYDDITEDNTLSAQPVIYDKDMSAIEITEENHISLSETEVSARFDLSYSKTVGISITPSGTPAEGYELEGVSYSFDSVVVKGTSQALADFNEIVIPPELLDLTDAAASMRITVNISEYLPDGVEIYEGASNLTVTARVSAVPEETTTAREETTAQEAQTTQETVTTTTSATEETASEESSEETREETSAGQTQQSTEAEE